MASPANMPRRQAERIGVFIDYENVRRSARSAFLDYGAEAHEGMVDPVELAKRVCARRQRPSTLGKVYVYRGRPSTEHQPRMASYFDKFRSLWERQAACKLRARELRYDFEDDGTFRAREKGIDVWLATDLIAAALGTSFDALVVVSSDTDLLPAVEYVLYDTPMHVEVATWGASGCYPLYVREELELGRKRPFCHYLSEDDFRDTRQDGYFG
ncbi:NYN domain-containing protein [Williamsia sterculiae]|uniref:NYN domain-containing protein n=1 Tax=Williamsia sterculiae TaxID=1344003 RepID=A0A1N7F894_9NOCA|nr:NYN domain-containing protein [Williamsia sterculiae]SIR96435.1 NYN domain-containing protein [Williamsia sterculiae]